MHKIFILIGIAGAVILGLCALFYFSETQYVFLGGSVSTSTPITTPASTPAPATTRENTQTQVVQGPRTVPRGAREYKSDTYRFSVLYPENLSVKEFDEGEGATTVTFQNEKDVQGLQIFIVPYGAAQITEERFKEDVPSGVRKNVLNTTIDGATGAKFYSTNSNLGETREVWFIKNGYLYEVTTLKSLEGWLDSILATWVFTQ